MAFLACAATAIILTALSNSYAGSRRVAAKDAKIILIGWSAHGIVDVDHWQEDISLVGTYERARGWRQTSGKQFARLLPAGGVWTVYELGVPPGQAVSQRAQPSSDIADYFVAPLKTNLRDNQPGGWITVYGTDFVDRGDVQVLPATLDKRAEMIRREAHRLGLWKSNKAEIKQNISVDLDGDSRMDRVLVIDSGEIGPIYLVLGAIQTKAGTFRLTAMTQKESQQLTQWCRYFGAEVQAVADLNGDGTREIAVRVNSCDYTGLRLYAIRQGRIVEVLQVDGAPGG